MTDDIVQQIRDSSSGNVGRKLSDLELDQILFVLNYKYPELTAQYHQPIIQTGIAEGKTMPFLLNTYELVHSLENTTVDEMRTIGEELKGNDEIIEFAIPYVTNPINRFTSEPSAYLKLERKMANQRTRMNIRNFWANLYDPMAGCGGYGMMD